MNFDVDDILYHIKLGDTLVKSMPIAIDVSQKGEYFLLTIITRDRPGLFATLTGMPPYLWVPSGARSISIVLVVLVFLVLVLYGRYVVHCIKYGTYDLVPWQVL